MTISDTLVDSLSNPSGDADSDGVLDTNETWVYTYTYTVQSGDAGETITNTATVDTNETDAASDTASVKVNPPCCNYSIDNPHANWGKTGGRGIHLHAKINGGGCTRETTLNVEIYHYDSYITKKSYIVKAMEFGQNQEWRVYERNWFEDKDGWKLKIWLETDGCNHTTPIDVYVWKQWD